MNPTRRTMFQGIAAAVVGLFAGKSRGSNTVRGVTMLQVSHAGVEQCRRRICPHCQAEGLASVTRQGDPAQGKCRQFYPDDTFWDKEGNRHDHLGMEYRMEFKCNRGHVWNEVVVEKSCWCGWPYSGPYPAKLTEPNPEWS